MDSTKPLESTPKSCNRVTVRAISRTEAVREWHWIDPLLNRIEADTGLSTEDLLTRIQRGEYQLWGVPGGVCVTSVTDLPQFRVCTVLQLAGDGLSEWFDPLMDAIEDWARQLGCKYVEEYGRKGWERIGKSRGYERAFTVMRKKL